MVVVVVSSTVEKKEGEGILAHHTLEAKLGLGKFPVLAFLLAQKLCDHTVPLT